MSNINYSSVIITGSLAYDIIMDFPSLFVDYFQQDKLHQINVSFIVDRLEKQLGGIATNIAYNLSLITKKKINILGGVGKDGGLILRFLKKRNIDISGIIIDRRLYSATGSVITDKNNNQIWGYHYGASKRGEDIDIKKHLNPDSLFVISASYLSSFLHFQKQAIESKINYFYDPGMMLTAIKKRELSLGIKYCRWLVGNDYEIAMILRTLKLHPKKLIKNKSVITTLGEKGVCYRDKKNHHHVSAYKLKKVVDPTGAGDAWRAGFIGGIIEGKSILDSLKLGNALASFAIESYGTVNHKPKQSQIYSRVKNLSTYQSPCIMI